MTKHVLILLIDHREWQDHPVFKSLSNAARSYSDITRDCICLLEFSMIIIDDNRIPYIVIIIKNFPVHIIPHLRPIGHVLKHFFVLGVIVDGIMWCFKNIEIECPVPGFVLSKYLCPGSERNKK